MKALKVWLHQDALSETMALILVLWLCSLITIGLIVTPWFGPVLARTVALGLLLVLLLTCWIVCIVRLVRKGKV
jgi:hypothetical protein